ncbi:MAG: hypothetical protein KAH24_07925 [Holophagae bacterium]|nr:hypothetical protein [Holophagae bacterium]
MGIKKTWNRYLQSYGGLPGASWMLALGPAIGGFFYEKLGSIPLWLSYILIGLLMIIALHTGAKPMFLSPPTGRRL